MKQSIGRLGESAAADYLEKHGYMIIERNFRTPRGEIDLIAQKNTLFAFVEVKTRTNNRGGKPEESVSSLKYHRVMLTAFEYLHSRSLFHFEPTIDVVTVMLTHTGNVRSIHHFKNLVF